MLIVLVFFIILAIVFTATSSTQRLLRRTTPLRSSRVANNIDVDEKPKSKKRVSFNDKKEIFEVSSKGRMPARVESI